MPSVLTANLQYAYDNAGPDVIVVNNLLDTLYDTSEVIRVTKKERFFYQVPYWERPDFFKYESQSVVGRIPANSMNSNSSDGSLVQDVNAKESLAIEEPVINVPLINAVAPGVSIHLFSGALAGMVGAVMLQPFDLLKTRLQQQHTSSNMIVTTTIAKELRKLTQVKDLWRGTLPSMVRTSIGAGLYFSILSNTRTRIATYKKKQTPDINITSSTSVLPKLSHFENLATGFVVRALVGLFTMPITIVKTRFESSMYNYKSIYEGVQGIYLDTGNAQKQKSLRNFFKGSVATLARDCPYAGLYVLFYEGFKNDVMPALNLVLPSDFQELNAGIINSSSAVLAASVSTTLTAPFDAIKTRLQLTNQSSIAKTTRALLSEQGGVRNLFRGLSLRLGRKGLSSGISWCIYEELIKSDLKSWSGKKRLA